MVAETLSSQAQTTFMPPVHFLNVIVQRGTITTFIPPAEVPGVPIIALGFDMGIPGTLIPARSITIADVIPISFGCELFSCEGRDNVQRLIAWRARRKLHRPSVVRPGNKVQRRIGCRA